MADEDIQRADGDADEDIERSDSFMFPDFRLDILIVDPRTTPFQSAAVLYLNLQIKSVRLPPTGSWRVRTTETRPPLDLIDDLLPSDRLPGTVRLLIEKGQ